MLNETVVLEEHASVILCGAWEVWTERNAILHGDGERSILQSVRWATEITIDLRRTGKEKKFQPAKKLVLWRPPELDTIKINVDAGFRSDFMDGTNGVVICDHSGNH
jgi:hypothetical protein